MACKAEPSQIRGLGPVKPHVKAAAEEIACTFGITNIGGFATSGHIPDSDHYAGLAIDAMIGSNQSLGSAVAAWALNAVSKYNIKYVIWNRHIWSVARKGEGWRPYSGLSPHTDHVHISFYGTAGSGVGTPSAGTVAPISTSAGVARITDPKTYLRVAAFLGGGVLLLVVLIGLLGRSASATKITAAMPGGQKIAKVARTL
jgi:hypothetical protein